MDYIVQTGRGSASVAPSREDAAGFWFELTGVKLPRGRPYGMAPNERRRTIPTRTARVRSTFSRRRAANPTHSSCGVWEPLRRRGWRSSTTSDTGRNAGDLVCQPPASPRAIEPRRRGHRLPPVRGAGDPAAVRWPAMLCKQEVTGSIPVGSIAALGLAIGPKSPARTGCLIIRESLATLRLQALEAAVRSPSGSTSAP